MVTANTFDLRIALPNELLVEFCRRWKITRLEVFGSVLRHDFSPESDVDFLYTFAPDTHWGWRFFDATEELSKILGRPVDLVSRAGIERSANVNRRREILSAARVIYAA